MLVINKAVEELKEILYEAKERACLACEYKEEFPTLASVYIDLANNAINQADKLHSAIVEVISKVKSSKDYSESMIEYWNFEHKIYIEKYEKAKLKIAMYSKL